MREKESERERGRGKGGNNVSSIYLLYEQQYVHLIFNIVNLYRFDYIIYKLHECDFSYGFIRSGNIFGISCAERVCVMRMRCAYITYSGRIKPNRCIFYYKSMQYNFIWLMINISITARKMCTRIHLINSNKIPSAR